MLSITALVGAFLVLVAFAHAHMQLHYPAPFNATLNPHRTTGADEYLIYPYDCCGPYHSWTYPCRGYHKLIGTPEGAPTAEWQAGSVQNFSLWGNSTLGGNHYGGSCQVGFSTDKGKNFHVATSYEGDCPHRTGGTVPDAQTFEFTVPQDMEAGVQIFAWIWYNREQEMNMNCAAVNIIAPSPPADSYQAPSGYDSVDDNNNAIHARTIGRHVRHVHEHIHNKRTDPLATSASSANFVAFSDRPLMLVADIDNGCLTPHTVQELKYPQPGPDVVPGDGDYPLGLPSGGDMCSAPGMLQKQKYDGSLGEDGHPAIGGTA